MITFELNGMAGYCLDMLLHSDEFPQPNRLLFEMSISRYAAFQNI